MRRLLTFVFLTCLAGCGVSNPAQQAAAPAGALSIAEEFNQNKPSDTPETPLASYDRSNESQLESFLQDIAAKVGRDKLVPTLLQHLRGDNKPRQIMSAAALIRHGTDTDASLTVLVKALADPNEWGATYAAQMLPRLRPASLSAIGPLARATTRSDAAGQAAAIAAASFGLPAVPHLIKALEQQDPAESEWTTIGLAEVGPLAVPALTEALAHENWFVRWGTAEALGQIGTRATSAAPALIPLLEDENPQVRATAANSLQRINANSTEVLASLLAAANDSEARVRSCVAVALGVLGKKDERVGPALTQLSKDPDADVRQAAGVGLNALSSAKIVPSLVKMLGDEHAHVRRIAVSGLIKAGPAAKEAWPKIHEAYQKAPEDDRDALAEALLRIDADAAEKEGITWETLKRPEKQFAPPPKN